MNNRIIYGVKTLSTARSKKYFHYLNMTLKIFRRAWQKPNPNHEYKKKGILHSSKKVEGTAARLSPNSMDNSEIMNVVSLIGYNIKERMYKVKFRY